MNIKTYQFLASNILMTEEVVRFIMNRALYTLAQFGIFTHRYCNLKHDYSVSRFVTRQKAGIISLTYFVLKNSDRKIIKTHPSGRK